MIRFKCPYCGHEWSEAPTNSGGGYVRCPQCYGSFPLQVPVPDRPEKDKLTLLLACLLMVGGVFKIVAALSHRFAAWAWPLVSGVIDLILGVMIWLEWPESALWVIGLFVGISLIFRGCNWIGLGLALRTPPPTSGSQPA